MKKTLKYIATVIFIFLPLCYFFPKLTLLYVMCGIYDVTRNTKLNYGVVEQYFLGNGILTWLLSPFNVVLDLLTFPYVNKGIYQLDDLPDGYKEEVQRLIDAAYREDLVGQIAERTKENPRSMIFFKWYGKNVDTFIDMPTYHEPYKYIQTIGVSVFNKKQSTSRHFGPFRATLRVLYNVNDIPDKSAYIEVGNTVHYWKEQKLFIFDDTLLHQSFNESDQVRVNLFIDIIRPAAYTAPLIAIVNVIRLFLQSVNYIFYKNWEVIKK